MLQAAANGDLELPIDRRSVKADATLHLPFAPQEVSPRFGMTMSLTTELDDKKQ